MEWRNAKGSPEVLDVQSHSRGGGDRGDRTPSLISSRALPPSPPVPLLAELLDFIDR